MCLASEAGKMDTAVSEPEDSSSSASTMKPPQIKEESTHTDHYPASTHTSALSPSLPFVTSTSTDAIPPHNSCQSTCVKKKNRKTEEGKTNDSDATTRISKKCDGSESSVDSVFSTIDAVARGAWVDSEGKPKIRTHISLTGGRLSLLKKKSNTKVKTFVKEKEELDDGSGLHGSSDVEMKDGIPDINLKAEEETADISTDLQGYVPELPLLEEVKERPGDPASEGNTENRGSRKSERSCKGALYKTLVSEGMLTSLRANIDRGKRGAFRAFDHDANWSHDSCVVSPIGPNNPKKLKKSKSKDESSQGLGKLEEEFERKFNSLPQFSPLTFDKKGTAVAKKRRTDGSTHQEDITKSAKGVQPNKDVQGTTSMEMLVGSQKRKARRTKITHLVRTADGSVSPAEEDKIRDPNQEQDKKPLTQQPLCNETRCCSSSREEEEAERSTVPQELPAFFSLAALAEVAAMENVHRGQRNLAQTQKKELSQTPVLISCADQ